MGLVDRAWRRLAWDDDPSVPVMARLDHVILRGNIAWWRVLGRLARRRPCGCYVLWYRAVVVLDCPDHCVDGDADASE